ncbi:MAG TPA: ATP-binding protein [Vicinamibacterales bacterium]|nr:ATP-binding protein [Vicinamibacterales bacterium]
MRLGIKGKQVLGVTSLVGAIVVILSVLHLSRVASVSLDESASRADLIANAVFHRAFAVGVGPAADPYAALRADPGLRSILEASLAYSKNVTYAALADVNGRAVLHGDKSLEGQPLPAGGDLSNLLIQSPFAQLRAIYSSQGQNLEHRKPLLLGNREIGSIRIGVSTLLIRDDLNKSLQPVLASALAALAVSVLVAMLLAQLLLRPIHLIRGGLTRLGRGEFGVQVNLGENDEFGELGTFFNTVSEQLSVDRSQMAGQVANLESAVQQLEDAVGIVNARGELLFANPALRAIVPSASPGARLDALLHGDHPLRRLAEQTLVSRQSRGPVSAAFGESGDRLVMTHAIVDPKGEFVGVMLIARNLEYLSEMHSTVRYSRKLAALGRLSAGVAHEVKNPLNAMMIHLELLRQQMRPAIPRQSAAGRVKAEGAVTAVVDPPPVDRSAALEHVNVIAQEIRRLDEVVQGFLKFTRAEDLRLQPITLSSLLDEIVPIVRPETDRAGVELVLLCEGAPDVNGDPAMLRQAFLNLALNACQAMPNGGTLRIACEAARGRRVRISVSDTGLGIKPEYLQRIFDLYFTTKEKGSGIGLSMVYRTVQMHDGDIEVQSTPGKGTTFTILLPQA